MHHAPSFPLMDSLLFTESATRHRRCYPQSPLGYLNNRSAPLPCSPDESAELYSLLTSQREMGMSVAPVVAQSTLWKVSLLFISGWVWLQRSSHMLSSAQILPRDSYILEENNLISTAFRVPGNLASTSPPGTHESCHPSLVRKWRANAKLINRRQLQFSLNWTNLVQMIVIGPSDEKCE